MTTIGTVSPAVTGTVPTGLPRTLCSAIVAGTFCAPGLKALSSGPVRGLPSWPTVSGVQTCPVFRSLNSGAPVDAAMSTLLRVACARAVWATVMATSPIKTFGTM